LVELTTPHDHLVDDLSHGVPTGLLQLYEEAHDDQLLYSEIHQQVAL
jgi:hypothetical protein